ncbi:STAS domain-containing protein [Streptomyces sp. NRRL WC-3742]|uniref:STAS domain-containing protein n=1 Tax=Streptomyces sp. NRRL WC-3742 TaxID=1463934 RepID=UPI00068F6DC8|nr:STAS domain-containing protein [Streptomyces sp. NRRL WC-3742]
MSHRRAPHSFRPHLSVSANTVPTAILDSELVITVRLTPPHVVTVTVAGEIDHCNADRVERALENAVTEHGTTVEVDLSAVTFCDCGGLNALLRARQHAMAAGRRLRVRAASRQVVRLCELTDTRALLADSISPDDPRASGSPSPATRTRSGGSLEFRQLSALAQGRHVWNTCFKRNRP